MAIDTLSHLIDYSLFTYVDPGVLTRPTFKAFVALQDNYDPTPHADDRLSTSDVNEADAFLHAVLQTKVMHTLLKFLMCKSKPLHPLRRLGPF